MKDISKDKWEVIVDDNYQDIYRFASRFLGQLSEARDVTQETFLYAYGHWPAIADSIELRRWLFVVARNKCIDRFRLWKRMQARVTAYFIQESVPQQVGSKTDVVRALEKLPRRQKEVFILRHWHDFSTIEVATILGINEGSVKSHLSRAIKRMSELLEDK